MVADRHHGQAESEAELMGAFARMAIMVSTHARRASFMQRFTSMFGGFDLKWSR